MLNADLNDNQFFEGKEICGWFNEDGTIMIQFINKGASFQISRTANDNIELLEELEECLKAWKNKTSRIGHDKNIILSYQDDEYSEGIYVNINFRGIGDVDLRDHLQQIRNEINDFIDVAVTELRTKGLVK